MGHSPLPWGYCGQEREKQEVCCCMQIWSKPADHPVAVVECGRWGDEFPSIRFTKDSTSLCPNVEPFMDIIEYGIINKEEAEANAAFIVKACNCHDELLAALKEVVRISDRKHDAWDRARAAIAKAEGL